MKIVFICLLSLSCLSAIAEDRLGCADEAKESYLDCIKSDSVENCKRIEQRNIEMCCAMITTLANNGRGPNETAYKACINER